MVLHEQVDIGAQVARAHVDPPKVAAAACEDRLPPAAPAAARHLGVPPAAGGPAAPPHRLEPARHVLRLVPVPVPDARPHDGAPRAGAARLSTRPGRRGVGEGARVILGVVERLRRELVGRARGHGAGCSECAGCSRGCTVRSRCVARAGALAPRLAHAPRTRRRGRGARQG